MNVSTELYWAAGFFDGEGSLRMHNPQGERSKYKYSYLKLVVTQKDRRPLERFQEAVGGKGKIYGPYTKGRPTPIHHWIAHGKAAEEVWKLLEPNVSETTRDKWQNK